ncbi:MAG TPA: single-stranded-DNA-specific exonuclease RecJ [Thermoleophilaceae bacterium]|nr:single-stranded-DNA-specific exonuclease RecJ [Thermoleophilaceae bacterium]
MALATARWTCTPYSVTAAERLAAELGVSLTTATVLVRRGHDTVDAATRFLAADERHDPFAFEGMDVAAETILAHVRDGSRIVVHGDYDVDGVCSTAILVRGLRRLGADPSWHIPARDDGYGLSVATVERLAAAGTRLIVTADCAVAAVDEVARARELGLDVVVTDHHRPAERLPDCPIVHPVVSGYPFPDLCAAGVAHKLVQALLHTSGGDPAAAAEDADLVGLATVADVVPLRGENRRLVREGVAAIARTRRPGLRALMAVAQLEPGAVDERALGFRLAPRINAAGRLARADAALELVLTDDPARAERIADELDQVNRERRDVETRIMFEAEAARAAQADAPAYVLAGEGWHPGVIGIVASRMVERYHRPCVLIALDHGRGRGSGRSISAFDLHAALAACSDRLNRFGGHRAAAGLEIEAGEVDAFRESFAAHAAAVLSPADLVPVERVDAVVGPDRLGVPLAEELELLRPLGHGNPAPTLLVPAARVSDVRSMGEDKQHARFTIAGGAARARAVAFRTTAASLPASLDDRHDAAVRLELNEWNGAVEPRLVLRALCPTESGECQVVGPKRGFEEVFESALRAGPVGSRPAHTSLRSARAVPLPATRPIGAAGPRSVRDRRGEGFAGVAGDLLSSGESVAIVCADVARRRPGLELVIGGIVRAVATEEELACPALVSWDDLVADPALAGDHRHLLALDPPLDPGAVEAVAAAPAAPGALLHLAWGPAETEFALGVARAELDLRPAVTTVYRALRDAADQRLLPHLAGLGLPPRAAARAVLVLVELGLVELRGSDGERTFELLRAERTELERSETYRACAARLAAVERDLGAEPARAA